MQVMSMNYWYKQSVKQPLFPELEWSRPENKMHAGKLLVIGGNLQGFSAPANAFNVAENAGIGMTRVLLPDAIRKTVGAFMPEADFAPTTPSGSFASESLAVFLENAAWSNATLLAGDFGRNSETAIVLEKFITKHHGMITLTKDAVDYFANNTDAVIDRQDTLLVISFAQLQKLATATKFHIAFTFSMDLIRVVTALHEFTKLHSVYIVVKHHNVIIVAANGQVSTTVLKQDVESWRVATAAHASVWWLQHPKKPFEALTQSIV